ncbi:hypothetical protein PInf_013783 [Phytophthora infestans]|nr:hypothetical protein PInf_029269 [Phytophthora infestans]KAI9996342.1 hypothetical protein PInf_013744 [Phytophthora infestans]KAI9996357.1 hypothetical protein PInf_013783 [Phytophthora infestans]
MNTANNNKGTSDDNKKAHSPFNGQDFEQLEHALETSYDPQDCKETTEKKDEEKALYTGGGRGRGRGAGRGRGRAGLAEVNALVVADESKVGELVKLKEVEVL